MTDPERPAGPDLEACFLAALPEIERITRAIARRHRLSESEAADFSSVVKLSMVESGYRVFSRFEGRGTLGSYLHVVIRRLLIDFLRKDGGKWRPSAAARRLGGAVVAMERLVFREGVPVGEAARLAAAGRSGCGTHEGLVDCLSALPVRSSRVTVSIEMGSVPEPADLLPSPDRVVHHAEVSGRLETLTLRALERLAWRDEQLIRLRFERGMTAAAIGRALGLSARRVYRRTDAILHRLRRCLEDQGLNWPEVADVVERLDWALRWSGDDTRAGVDKAGRKTLAAA